MRRARLLLPLVLLMALGSIAPASGVASPLVPNPVGIGGVQSANVSHVGTLPLESPGIGARVLKVGDQVRFYTTGAKGLSIFDITNPAAPRLLGQHAFAHFQNEDVDVSDDGARVIISTDTASAETSGNRSNGIRVIDTSNPAAPRQTAMIANSNHTTTCADAKCEWLYGSNGRIYDATKPGAITDTGKSWGGSGHALNRDASGLMISDSTPRRVLDVSDPANPKVLATGRPNTAEFGKDGLLQHNNVRPAAEAWVPREAGDDAAPMRAGELLLGNSESNVNPRCSNAGGLSSWNMTNFDKGAEMKQVDVFRPLNGTWANGSPAANALGCSGHWFTVSDKTYDGDYLVTASWYEHGVRFFRVNATTGKIREVGYFQPVVTQAGAAHWVTAPDGSLYVYTTDYARGIDVLKFNPAQSAEPTQAEIDNAWISGLGRTGQLSTTERYLCALGARNGG